MSTLLPFSLRSIGFSKIEGNRELEKSRVRQLENHYSDTIGNHYLVYIELTSERLYKQALVMKQICKLFPLSKVTVEGHNKYGSSGQYDQICNAVLPQGLNPLSVPPKELAASLGYMVQLLNLVVHKLAVPALHNLGFGSGKKAWHKDATAEPYGPPQNKPKLVNEIILQQTHEHACTKKMKRFLEYWIEL
ncbi:hypothetical protein F2Q69_00051814 [Brassica cretica]|uniref:Uncharacterized protein n=1 Tax=Brassica cretica TaxID=69181 RepID=A0A8S9PS92_BRACR|nr:hypothetical protein F2Q69_00051814 [Brassica cretica]